MTRTASLPPKVISDSAAGTRLYFDTYGKEPLEFGVNEVSASIAFFEARGFDHDAALQTATILLKQAKIDGIPVFQLLDTLKSLNGIQISAIVAEILNNNRSTTSTLGYKFVDVTKENQTRNIFP